MELWVVIVVTEVLLIMMVDRSSILQQCYMQSIKPRPNGIVH